VANCTFDVNAMSSLCEFGRGSINAIGRKLRVTEKCSFRVRQPCLAATAEAIRQL